METETAYDELIGFIANGSTREQVAQYTPSEATQTRAYELLQKEKDGIITPEETAELNYYTQLEHILRMAKARARLALKQNYAVASASPKVAQE